MNVLVDTCIWSLLLRHRYVSPDDVYIRELRKLIQQTQVILLGIVRQEVLSGIRHAQHLNVSAKNYVLFLIFH
jgi:hypothetical protein